MRKLLFQICLLNFSVLVHAQNTKIDSLSALLRNERTDSNRVSLLWRLAGQYQAFKPDTSLQLAQEALLLAQRIKFTEGESRSLALLAGSQYQLGNYPGALNNYMLKLKIEEKRNSPRNYASALSNIGLMYILLEEYPHALTYLYRADSTVESAGGKTREELKYSIMTNIGEAYYRMKKPDSADMYFQRSLNIAREKGDKFFLGASMLGIANVLSLKQNYREALQYYNPSVAYLEEVQNNDMLCEATLGMARVYEKLLKQDSAVFFGSRSFITAQKDGFLSRQLDASLFLSEQYKKRKQYDSAFFYFDQSVNLKDTIMGQQKIRQALTISSNEQIRQAELAEQKRKDKEARFKQLQLLAIAIFIPLFFLITLFISRISVHRTIIKFMGIISLLLLFEYLTLLLHPFVAGLTNHLPLLELLIFVIIASGLIPLHHRLEDLLMTKLNLHKERQANFRFRFKRVKFKIKK